MPAIQNVGRAEYENASISIPPIFQELESIDGVLSKECKDWQELSEREKRSRIYDRYDEIACGAFGKWESLDLDLAKPQRGVFESHLEADFSLKDKQNATGVPERSETAHDVYCATPIGDNERGRSNKRGRQPLLPETQNAEAATVQLQALMMPRSSSLRTHASRQSTSRSVSIATDGRARASSGASSSTLSRKPSRLTLRTPSVAVVNSSNSNAISGAPLERRLASASLSSTSSVPDPNHIGQTAGGASVALTTLLAAQARLGGIAKVATASNEKSGGWFWNRKAKATKKEGLIQPPAATPLTADVFKDGTKSEAGSLNEGRRHSISPGPARESPSATLAKLVPSPSITSAAPTDTTMTDLLLSTPSGLTQPRPIGMTPTPAAFKVATNDVLSVPRSLEEHGMHRYFSDTALIDSSNTHLVQENVEASRVRRLERLNPSNPTRSSGMLQDQSRRWTNIFPRAGRINNQRSVKWKSLCTPACLPLYSDYVPTPAELATSYAKETYSLPVTPETSSFLLYPGKEVGETAGNLLRELVCQRLAQSFQIIMPPYHDLHHSGTHKHSCFQSESLPLPRAHEIRDILYNTRQGEGKPIFLGFSNVVHQIHFDRRNSNLVVSIWKKKEDWSRKSCNYSFVLWPAASQSYTSRSVTFAYPDLTAYDWQYTDRLVAGLEESNLQEKTRYWRTRFILVPTEVSDFKDMIKSQSRYLLDDSTEDDLRIAGLIMLYEQFSKARWTPHLKHPSIPKTMPLSVFNRVYPSICSRLIVSFLVPIQLLH